MKKADLPADLTTRSIRYVNGLCQLRPAEYTNAYMGKDVKRLFAEFKPENYELSLVPDNTKKRFHGSVTVHGQKTYRPNKRFTFHQNGLKITGATVIKHDKSGDQEITVSRINHQKSMDEVRIHTEAVIYPGRYSITLEFTGKITRAMNGIYPCFFDHDGSQEQIIATQFESHHAREVFPCIDEPEAKATFDLTLTTPHDAVVLANTPVKQEASTKQGITTTFETTPRMSTYLLAFVYGKLGHKEAVTKDGVLVRAFATPENVAFTDFALEVAVKCLEFYNDYFGIAYPLPKCDMVALPDFASGAMENWGLVTYREQCMLVDPQNTSLPTKQYVAMVVAHELAHQWFGNLVTMRWWTDLWLNEGFASWVEYLAVDHIFPEWEMWTQFAVDEQQRAFKLDALEHTHPIEVAVHHPDEIRTIFDTISYSKGASAIHMLHNYLGAEMFRDGLRHYLDVHKYGNTDTVDLWSSLEHISGKPVKAFMHQWTSQSGFPLLSATIHTNRVELTQERFLLNQEHSVTDQTLWPIPLLSKTSDLPELFDHKSTSLPISSSTLTKFNLGQCGFYRTVYDASHLERLAGAVHGGTLTPLDRIGVLSDMFEAAKAGKASTVDVLHLLESYADETDNAVWDIIAGVITSTRAIMDDEPLRELMKPYIQKLVAKQLSILGWEPQPDESHFQKLLRPTILGLAAGADEPSVVQECLRQFDAMTKPEDIAPDVRSIVYTTAVRLGDKKTFDKLFAIHESSTSSEERTTIAAALTNFRQPELISQALKLVTTESVRLQDVSYWVAYSFSNRFARDKTWQWTKKHWDWLHQNLGTDLSFYRFPMYAANAQSNREFLQEYRAFFEPKSTPAFERAIKQGIEVITWQSAWKERDFDAINEFFKAHL
jgi:puromycin-sensitive aminopeptidase